MLHACQRRDGPRRLPGRHPRRGLLLAPQGRGGGGLQGGAAGPEEAEDTARGAGGQGGGEVRELKKFA